MADATLLKLDDLPIVKRGDGVETTLLVGRDRCGLAKFTSGLTRFPAEKKVPVHHHNCDEQVTLTGRRSGGGGRRRTDQATALRHDLHSLPGNHIASSMSAMDQCSFYGFTIPMRSPGPLPKPVRPSRICPRKTQLIPVEIKLAGSGLYLEILTLCRL